LKELGNQVALLNLFRGKEQLVCLFQILGSLDEMDIQKKDLIAVADNIASIMEYI